jgi:hypothetical protein
MRVVHDCTVLVQGNNVLVWQLLLDVVGGGAVREMNIEFDKSPR